MKKAIKILRILLILLGLCWLTLDLYEPVEPIILIKNILVIIFGIVILK